MGVIENRKVRSMDVQVEEISEGNNEGNLIAKKKMSKKKKILLTVFGVLFFIFASILGYGIYLTIQVNRILEDAFVYIEVENLRGFHVDFRFGEEASSILLLGIDTDDINENALSDAMMLITINPGQNSTKIVSLNRLLMFHEDRENFDPFERLLYYYFFGGAQETVRQLQAHLNVPIDRFVAVDFNGFAGVIDALGGVSVYNDGEEFVVSGIKELGHITISHGEQHLNGEGALAFARGRMHDPLHDEGRQIRQRQVIEAVLDSIDASVITNHLDIMDAVDGHFSHNLLPWEIVRLLTNFVGGVGEIQQFSIDGERYVMEPREGEAYPHEFIIANPERVAEISRILREHLELPVDGEE